MIWKLGLALVFFIGSFLSFREWRKARGGEDSDLYFYRGIVLLILGVVFVVLVLWPFYLRLGLVGLP